MKVLNKLFRRTKEAKKENVQMKSNQEDITNLVVKEAGSEILALTTSSGIGDEGTVKSLLSRGVDVDALAPEHGMNALMRAAARGQLNIVKILLDHGANVNVTNDSGLTALMVASYVGNNDIIQTFLERGADINIKDNEGATAFTYAQQEGHQQSMILLNPESKLVYAECIGHSDQLMVDYVLCSDSQCPCDQTKLYRNSGYIYVNKEFVEFRRDCLTWRELENKLERIRLERDLEFFYVDTGIGVPIMICEQGAKLRGLNLEVAASDARHWWKTGLVPLRVTPEI